MFDFHGKVAIVTGAAMGLGAAIARELAPSGARLVLADIDAGGVQALADEIGTDSAVAVRADVSNPEDVEAMVSRAISHFGRLDLAVNNAGVGALPRRRAAMILPNGDG